jgi:hypothetical protein
MKHEAPGVCSKEYDEIVNEFLKRLSQVGGYKSSIKSLFKKIITYIPRAKFSPDQKKEQLVHFKVLYDMLRFIYQNNPEVTSSHFKKSLAFQHFQAFEECIGFISTLHNYEYVVSTLILKNIQSNHSRNKYIGYQSKEKYIYFRFSQYQNLPDEMKQKLKGSYYLANFHHKFISNFDQGGEYKGNIVVFPSASTISNQVQELRREIELAHPYVQSFTKGKSSAEHSLKKIVFQHAQYYIQVSNLRGENEDHSDLLNLIETLYSTGKEDFLLSAESFKNSIFLCKQN